MCAGSSDLTAHWRNMFHIFTSGGIPYFDVMSDSSFSAERKFLLRPPRLQDESAM